MEDITILLRAAGRGDTAAADQVMALLYDDLRRIAHSRLRASGELTLLDTHSLVHEAWLRLQNAGQLDFGDRQHFMAYAARVMRNIVVDAVRARNADRRGGGDLHVPLDTEISESVGMPGQDLLRLHEALEELSTVDARLVKVVEMRFFAGLSENEIADCLGVTERTVQRDWRKARALLKVALK